jgi:Putative prokaryotic signal transducing protein
VAVDRNLVLAYRSFSLPRAEVIIGMLNAYGVAAVLFDRDFNGNNGHLLLATGGFRIMVPAHQVSDAVELLAPFQDSEESPESDAFKKKPLRNIFWLLVMACFGVWAPAWLRKRDS